MLINTEDPSIDMEDMDTSMSYYSNLLSDDPFNLDMESSLPSETDLLQHLSSKLEIPVGLDDDIPKDSDLYDDSSNLTADNVLLEPLLNLLDTEGSNWGIDSFPNLTAYQDDPKCKVKMEIKQEEPDSPNGLPPSPSSSSSGSINGLSSVDAWGFSHIEPKVVLETPPFSPPVESDNSPPNSPQSGTSLNINNINIIRCINNANSTNNAQRTTEPIRVAPPTVKVVPSGRTAKGVSTQRIQPRPENSATPNSTTVSTATWSNNSSKSIGEKRKTIVLSAKDFAALAYGACSTQVTRVVTPSTNSITPVTQATIRVQPVATTSLATQAIPAKVPLIPCQPLSTSVPLPTSMPITLASGTVPVMTCATTPSTTLVPTIKSSAPVKREMEMKAIKRQQRMIKNRESACLSRKKKKEYVSSLENEISKLQQENVQLKLENEALKQQVKDMESISLLTNFPRPSLLSRPKKAATVLCAVLVLFTLNFGTFNGLMGNRVESFVGDVASRSTQVEHHGRTLLWASNIVDPSGDQSESVNSDTDAMFPPTLHPICPLNPINRTESIRLDSELRRWIGVDVETPRNTSQPSTVDEANVLNWIILQREKQPKNAKVPHDFPSKSSRRRTSRKTKEPSESTVNAVDLYQKTRPPLHEYAAFLDSFPRRQDTFYVVSFSGDHILLPARALNSSIRPKMSLVLPAMPFNASAPPHKPMTMMQIDCEVINTQIVQVKETDIPPHVRAKDHEATRPLENPKFAPKKKPAVKSPSVVNETSSQAYNNISLNATSKMDKVDVFANSTESAAVSNSLNKANDTHPVGSQSYRPYFVNSDYNPEKFPPSKLNAAFLRSSYSSQSNEYPNVGKRVARFP